MTEDPALLQNAESHLRQARDCLANAYPEKTLSEIETALLLAPGSWPVLAESIPLLLEAEQAGRAAALLKSHLAGNRSHAEAWGFMGWAQAACGDFSGAVEAYRKAHDLEPGSVAYCDQWISSLLVAGRGSEAMKRLQELEQSGSLSVVGHHLLAMAGTQLQLVWDRAVKVGMLARVCSLLGAGPAAGLFFKSRFELVDGVYMHLAYPSAEGALFPWTGPGQTILVAWPAEGRYLAFLTQVDRRQMRPVPILVARHAGAASQIQRRYYLRVPLSILETVEWKGRVVDAFEMVDLSVGGCAVRARGWECETGDRVHCHLRLAPEKVIPDGQVIRIERSRDGTRTVAIRFDPLPAREADRLARAVHRFQIEMRRKGIS